MDILDNPPLNDGHVLEALDRVSSVVEIVQHMLVDHSLIQAAPDFRADVDQVTNILGALYQKVGQYDTIEDMRKVGVLPPE